MKHSPDLQFAFAWLLLKTIVHNKFGSFKIDSVIKLELILMLYCFQVIVIQDFTVPVLPTQVLQQMVKQVMCAQREHSVKQELLSLMTVLMVSLSKYHYNWFDYKKCIEGSNNPIK